MEVAHDGQSVSTLMDGELGLEAAEREIARLKTDAMSRHHWDTFHLIGDAMRGGAAGTTGFCARFSERLAAEPTVIAPHKRLARGKVHTYVLSAAASVAAVAVVGWVALSTMTVKDGPVSGQLANGGATQPSAVVASQAPSQPNLSVVPPGGASAPVSGDALQQPQAEIALAPEQVQEYMLAHQGISPTTAFQGVAPYIRTVSSTGE